MAAPNPYVKRCFPSKLARESIPIGQTRSYTLFLCKSLFFALFLIALPLFPSQAPDFIKQTIFTKFWELIHLLFVGIAVSYGLFSRRNVDMEIDFHSSTVDDSQSYMSKMFDVSSNFEHGYENSCGFVEKNDYNTLNSRHYKSESKVDMSKGSSVLDERNKHGSFNVENGIEFPCGNNESNVIQAWNSKYFHGESMLVVAEPNYGLDEYIDYKPLGLPVRSLRSRVKNPDTPEFSDGSASSSSVKGSSKSSDGSINGEFGDLGPTNLEKFNETVALPSTIPWRLRSGRMEMRENMGGVTRPSHFRPLSVDETQFESLESRSLRSKVYSSTQTSSMSNSPSRLSTSHSLSSESSNSEMKELGKEKNFRWSYPPTSPSQSPPTPVNGKASVSVSHSQHYIHGSLSEEDERRSFEDDSEDFSGSRRKDSLGRRDWRSSSLKLGDEDLGKENSFRRSYPPTSPSPPTKGEASLNGLYSRNYSDGSLLEEDVKRRLEDDSKDLSGFKRKVSIRRRDRGSSSLKLGAEEYGKEKSFHEPYPLTSPSPPTKSKASMNGLHSRHFSHNSLLEEDVRRSQKDDSKELSGNRRKDSLHRRDWGSSSLTLGAEEYGKEKSFHEPYPLTSPSPPTKSKASMNGLHSRHFSHGSLLEEDVRRSQKDDSKELSGNRRKDSLHRRDWGSSSLKLGAEQYGNEKSFHGPYPPISTSPPTNGKASMNGLHSRHFSQGSLLEKDVSRRFKDDFKDLNRSGRKDSMGNKEWGSGSLKWESKPASIAKASSRGKSVRTLRSSGYTMEAIQDGDMCANRLRRTCDEDEALYMQKNELRGEGLDNLSTGTSKQNLGDDYPIPKPRSLENQKRGKQQCSENSAVESGDDSESEAEQFQVSSDEEALPDTGSDAGYDSNEVDKKAGEFIAKFREQIRLQKMASIETPRGPNIGDNYFR